jgi:type 1 glutamine amidotransferase
MHPFIRASLTAAAILGAAFPLVGADKKIVFVAGRPSHSSMAHEHRAGCLLLQKCLRNVPGLQTVVVSNGWPSDESVFQGASAIVIYADGGSGHPAIQDGHLQTLGRLMKQGVGLGCIHYAVEVPKDKGGPEFLQWIGGYFETFWSVNPHWNADFKSLPAHPVTRGVKPFQIRDEWYYHMRFPADMKGVTPILSAIPPDGTRGPKGANDSHGGNPAVYARLGMAEDVMWVRQRPDGGRGFGFTGGHDHRNWGNENFRKVVLNAILWMAHVDVPPDGVASSVSPEDLKANLDP